MSEAQTHAAAIARGELSAVEATKQAIVRIEEADGEINAVAVRDFERALDAAAYADKRLADGDTAPLLGVPMTVKESIDIAGLPTTWGLPEHAQHTAAQDAIAVRRLKKAGAVILGKTNVSPALADLQAVNEVYGATQNPHLYGRTAGGSSGGSAAALAAGFTALEVGSDIGGSIRLPAGFCGVWGLKPTYGLVNSDGHYFPGTDGAASLLGVVGPLARTASDLALLLGLLADHPLADPWTSLDGKRVAVITEHPVAPIAASVRAALERTAASLEASGVHLEVNPELGDLAAQHKDYVKLLNTVLARGVPPKGKPPLSAPDWFDLEDKQARNIRFWDDVLSDRYDAILAPTFSTTAFPIDDLDIAHRQVDVDGESIPCATQLAWAGLATYPNLPSVSFPAGQDGLGLPIGLQLIGRKYTDRQLIALAEQVSVSS